MKLSELSVYVRNKNINPSSYYRIFQYVKDINMNVFVHSLTSDKLYDLSLNHNSEYLKLLIKFILYLEMNIKTFFFIIYDLIKKPDIIFIQREILPKRTSFFIKKMEKMLFSRSIVIWDIDDDILENKEVSIQDFEFYKMYSKYIICSTEALAEKLFPDLTEKIIIIPTTDGDINKKVNSEVIENRRQAYDNEIKLIWIGTTGNLDYIRGIIHILDDCAKELLNTGKQLTLYVVSGQNLDMHTAFLKIENIKWSRTNAIDSILKSHIGLMPLLENPFTMGKASFKLIQYLSAGLPIIGSAVGYNNNVINDKIGFLVNNEKDWLNSILFLSNDLIKYFQYSTNSLDFWSDTYSYTMQLKKIKKILNDAIDL